MRTLLFTLLLALPTGASAITGEECRAGLAAFETKPDFARFQSLIPCLDDLDPSVRDRAFDKLCRREVWEDPRFKDLFPALDAVAAKGQRDPATRGNADSFRWWLRNSQEFEKERRKAAAAAATASDEAGGPRRIRLSLIFGAGIVLQTLIFVLGSGNRDPWGLLVAGLTGLGGLIPGKHERHYALDAHLAYCFLIYAVVVFARYKKDIMARVSESSLLVNSLTLWYLGVTFLGGHGRALVLALAALPTIGTLVVAFTIREWSFPAKLACYVWFLVLSAANTAFQLRFGDLLFLFAGAEVNPVDLFLTGMSFAVLLASLFYVYILIPIADKNETQQHRMQRWREDAHFMASCFADYRLTPAQALQIILAQVGLYVANSWTRWMLPASMMNVSIVVLPMAFGLLFRGQGGDVASPVPAPQRALSSK